jgi:hypothetical protein
MCAGSWRRMLFGREGSKADRTSSRASDLELERLADEVRPRERQSPRKAGEQRRLLSAAAPVYMLVGRARAPTVDRERNFVCLGAAPSRTLR